MADLELVMARALAASEAARREQGARRALVALAAPAVAWLLRPEDAIGVATLAALAFGIGIATSCGRGFGRGAIEGTFVSAVVVLAASLADACAPGLDGWHCGVPCLALGMVGAVLTELLVPEHDAGRGRRTVALAFGSVGAFAGCAHLGIGVAVAAALATAIGRLGVLLARPLVRGA